MNKYENKNIVILGPTSSGKTGLAVRLALAFDGEVVSADSRQVYRGMDIGTGKDLDEYEVKQKTEGQRSKIIKIPYHLIDVVSPNTEFDLAKFVKKAKLAIADIHKRAKLPIIAGGTGLYTEALVDNYVLSQKGPDKQSRNKLNAMGLEEVYQKLKTLNSGKAESLNNSERNNKRRLIRYIELEKAKAGKPKKDISCRNNYLILGVFCPKDLLYERINKRLVHRLEKEGMVEEVKRLHKKNGVSWKRLASFGLEYKYISMYLRGQLDHDKMLEQLDQAIRHFSKRQMSWYRRWERAGTKINWVNNYGEARKLVNDYLK